VADRIAQTVVVARLEQGVEPMFHADSYGSPGTIGAGCGGLVPGTVLEARLGYRS